MTPFVHTERLVLRPLTAGDATALVAYRGDPEVAQFQSWMAFDEEVALGFIAEMANRQPGRPGEGYQMAVALAEDDRLIGDLYVRPLDYDPRQAEIGYTLARTFQGRGYATEAVTGLLEFLFRTLDLHRVIAYTAVENKRSVKLLRRVGFRREGRLVQSLRLKDRWYDEYLFAILKTDWCAD